MVFDRASRQVLSIKKIKNKRVLALYGDVFEMFQLVKNIYEYLMNYLVD